MSSRRTTIRRVAIVFGPALVVVSVGIGLSAWPLRSALRESQTQREAIAASIPRAADLATAQEQAEALRTELAALQPAGMDPASAVQSSASGDPAGRSATPPPERSAWHRALTDVLHRHTLAVIREQRTELALPIALANAVPGGRSAGRCSAWSLQIAGNYLDVMAALAALQSSQHSFLVLDLTMTRDAAGALLWTLTVT